jgi:hypothetical protein
MGLYVKNNRDGKSYTLLFVILVVVYVKEDRNDRVRGRLCMGKKVFHTRFSLVRSLVACTVFHFK